MTKWGGNGEALFFDIETYSASDMWDRNPRDMFRLGQYAWGKDGDVILTEDYDEMLAILRSARMIIGHNIHSFDLTVMFGKDSIEPLQMALDKRIIDTMTWASLVYPSPTIWTDSKGHTHYDGNKPEKAMIWLGLDNLAHQFKLPGKVGSLRELAKKYNPPKTLVKNLDYGLIPTDDPEFMEYAEGDIISLRAIAYRLLSIPGGMTPYMWREQKFAAICAQNARNGWLVDAETAQARVDELAEKRDKIIAEVVTKYGLPTEGKMPWRTTEGKDAIFTALADYGITPGTRPDWPLTATKNPSLGGDALIALTKGTPAADLGEGLAALMGQRSLAQLALDSMHTDGLIHPSITYFQRSGRLSVTKPGLTVWTSRGEGAVEKAYFVARSGYKLVSFDYSNADARAVAAYSGDKEYIKRFEAGVDAHELSARLTWGDEVYESMMLPGWETDDEIRKKNPLRHTAKMLSHAYSYGARPKTLMLNSAGKGYPTPSGEPIDIETTTRFCEAMDNLYSDVVKWQRDAANQGKSGAITNDWGRRMVVDPDRAFTQSSALLGQSGTREILVDGLIELAETNIEYITYLKAQIHDEVIMELPVGGIDKAVETVVRCLSTVFKPKGTRGQAVEFTVSHGHPADNWYEASH